ncbi:hypothetical protein ACK83U_00975 [Rhizobium sp. WW22]|uniref:hypothetical protein n=1 Tax=Rhizobium sp. WW22 TaxID=3389070 RepID=UPI00399B011C
MTLVNLGYVNSRDDVAAIDPSLAPMVYLTEPGREGIFIWTAGDFSAKALIDWQRGMIIPSSIIAATQGAYVRFAIENRYNIRWFGAVPNGPDCASAFSISIALLSEKGGEIYVPGGEWWVASLLSIGNGDAGAAQSTRNAVKIVGEGAGFASYSSAVPSIIKYVGTATTAYILDYLGRICNCELHGILIDCNSLCGGLRFTSISGCRVDGIKIINPASKTIALKIQGGNAPTGNYNIYNFFGRISINLKNPESIGLRMDGVIAASNDTWLSMFELVRIETVAGATKAVCAWLKFVDSISFHRCHFESSAEPTSFSLVLDALDNDQFPAGIGFYDCSIDKVTVYEDANHKIRKCVFANHGTNDEEALPDHPMLVGYTDNGLWFGPFGYALGAGGSVTQQTSKSTTVTLDKPTGVITMHPAAIPAGAVVSFILKNACITSADTLTPNITGGGSYGAYHVGVSDVQNGVAVISVRNMTGGSLAEAISIGFTLTKGAAA